MPWKPTYTEAEARIAIDEAANWKEVLHALSLAYHGKNIDRIRRWSDGWMIDTSHLSDRRGSVGGRIRYTEEDARAAIEASLSWAEALRKLGYCPSGGNPALLQKRAAA